MVQLEGRRREILRAVIDDYIESAEPVGSEAICDRHRLGVSAATIRNEMAGLEEMGFLHQPHTSAGRVPTDQGYRVYVDSLLHEEQVPSAQRIRIRRTLSVGEPERAAEQAARALASLTDLPSVVAAPRADQQRIRHLHLIPVALRRALIVVVTDAGVFQGQTVEFPDAITAEDLERLSQGISRRIVGRPLGDLTDRVLDTVIGEAALSQRVLDQVARLLRERFLHPSVRVYTEGKANILKQPEFQDIRRAQPVLSALEKAEVVEDLLSEGQGPERVWIRIGTENRREEMKDCSIVSATYDVGGRSVGVLGIIGPTRIPYGKVISLVRFLADSLGDALSQI